MSTHDNWKFSTLTSICTDIVDCPHSTPNWTTYGKIVLRSQNIRNGKLDLTSKSFTDEENFRNRIKRIQPLPGDLVITREAPMGEVCLIPEGLECCLGQRMVLLRPNRILVDNRYLLYALQSPFVQHEIQVNEGTGSTVSNLRIPVLESLPIPLPPLPIQQRIADILGALDDKIELNRKQNETLEAMARALFKAWFVDFEPVRAKQDGRWQRGQSLPGLPANLYDLFPDRLVDSELGEIPQGWGVGKVGEFAIQVKNNISPSEIASQTAYIALEHMPKKSLALTNWSVSDNIESNKSVFLKGDFLFGKLRPYFHKVGIAPVDGVCSTDILVVRPKKPSYYGYTIMHLSSDALIQHCNQASDGTRMPRTSWADIAKFEVALPSPQVLQLFNSIFLSMSQQIQSNINQIVPLTDLRDTLLPKLLSGELAV